MAATSGTGTVPAPGATTPQNDISLAQRMTSATCGSVLTSILVTPLDVVRVRLQSQSSTALSNRPLVLPPHTTQSLRNIPPNLGVTSCCREIFWIGDNAHICMLGPNTGAGTLGSASASASAPTPATASASALPSATDCAVEETQRKTFSSTFDGLRKIARNEGPLTLWRGLSPTLMMGIPANVIYFSGYDWLRYDDRSIIKQAFSANVAPLVAGSIARIVAASVINPIEMFRTRLQATPGHGAGHFKATLESLQRMTQAKGYSALWRGLALTMWRDVPFSGMYWWGYEEVKSRLIFAREQSIKHHLLPGDHHDDTNETGTSTFFESFLSGAISGSVAAFVTTPFDVGKTRQQVFRHLGDDLPGPVAEVAVRPEQLSLPKFLYHIFREEGFPGLFRGWVARCLKVAPACAIMISTYEIGKKMARDVNEKRHLGLDSES